MLLKRKYKIWCYFTFCCQSARVRNVRLRIDPQKTRWETTSFNNRHSKKQRTTIIHHQTYAQCNLNLRWPHSKCALFKWNGQTPLSFEGNPGIAIKASLKSIFDFVLVVSLWFECESFTRTVHILKSQSNNMTFQSFSFFSLETLILPNSHEQSELLNVV